MSFRFTHESDTHGRIIPYNDNSIMLIHSGDFLPNKTRGIRSEEEKFQKVWLLDNIDLLKEWINGRVFVFCRGNHDFFDPIPIMKDHGINAYNITNKAETICGLKMYGFPYIPWLAGEWNGEKQNREMSDLVGNIPTDLDILVAHCPPYGILDTDELNTHCGNTSLVNRLMYRNEGEKLPRYLLSGHMHKARGIALLDGMVVSNAATTTHTFEM